MAQSSCFVIIGAAIITIALAEDFCSMQSCYGGVHTMCKFPTENPGRACLRLDNNKLTDAEKKKILEKHNELRKTVASGKEKQGLSGPQPAGIIPPLEWDEDLAEVAQRWANQCDFGHDGCRNTANFHAGQNVAIEMASNAYPDDAALTRMVQRWYDEVKFFDRREIHKYRFEPKTGHYTQLIWGTTTHVGCGVAKFKDRMWYKTYLVCNYGPSGNWIGQQVYETQ